VGEKPGQDVWVRPSGRTIRRVTSVYQECAVTYSMIMSMSRYPVVE